MLKSQLKEGGMAPSLIAPCGMNCRLCMAYQRSKNHCPGCYADDASKPTYCRSCQITTCQIRANIEGCYACEKYPCTRLKQLDKRYRGKYHMSMLDNLNYIRDYGMDAFIQHEKERWACPDCGAVVCVHRNNCPGCDKVLWEEASP